MSKPLRTESLTKEEIEEKLKKWADRFVTWKEDHEGNKQTPPPLVYDDKTDEFTWVNRETRRKMRKRK